MGPDSELRSLMNGGDGIIPVARDHSGVSLWFCSPFSGCSRRASHSGPMLIQEQNCFHSLLLGKAFLGGKEILFLIIFLQQWPT